MPRSLRALPLVLLLAVLLSPRWVQSAGSRTAPRVIARGPLAGTQLFVSLDGLVRPEENRETGAAGRVGTSDGGRTWIYQDAGGGAAEVVALDDLPTHLQRLSGVISRLQALGRRDRVLTADDLVTPVLRELLEARDAWRAQGGASLREPDVQAALRELDGVLRTLSHAASGTDEEVASAYRDVLPRLHSITALALAQPRDGTTVTVKQTVIDFGVVPVGSTNLNSIGLSTTADGEVIVSTDVSGLAAPFSSAGGDVSVFKASGGSLQITFAPAAAGDFQGTVVLTNPGFPGGKVTVQVTGSARTEPLVVLPSKLDFGKIPVKSFKTLKLTVVNNSAQAATIATKFTGGQSDGGPTLPFKKPFSTSAPGDVNGTFQPHEVVTVNVTFSPTKIGNFQAEATVTSSLTPGAPITVKITGEAVGPVTIGPGPLTFGVVNVGTSETRQLTITNNTDQPLPINLKAPGPPYTISTVPATLAAHETITVTVTFTPTDERSYGGGIEVGGGVKGLKINEDVKLAGSGEKRPLTGLKLSKDSVAFGVVPRNTQGMQSFTITNMGKAVKTVTLDTSGLNSTFFHLQGSTSFTLNPGAVQTVTITFFATGACTHKDKLVVLSDGGMAEVPVTASAK